MNLFNMTVLGTEEILSGLDELIAGMKKDSYLDKKFSAILEDSKRRIKSCEWIDYTKGRPDKNIMAVFKYPVPWGEESYVRNFYEEEKRMKRNFEEDGWCYKEGELFWKPLETEHELDLNTVMDGLFELSEGMAENEYLKSKYENLIDNIIERVSSGEWRNFRGNHAVYGLWVIYKALYYGDEWRYGTSLYDPNAEKLVHLRMPDLYETILWKPLEIEKRV